MAVAFGPFAAPVVSPRSTIQRSLRVLALCTALLDLALVALAVLLAWDLREWVDIWFPVPGATAHVVAACTPYLISSWFLILVAHGAYSLRNVGAGTDEFRTVAMASVITAGLVGLTCYLLQLPLSRGFVLFTFLIGTPLLLLGRVGVRRVAHVLRRHGRMRHRVVAVGGASGVSEVVDALRRSKHAGYEVVGACLPHGVSAERDRFDVPVLGTVEETRRMCREVGADTVLVARGGDETSAQVRRIAWALEGSGIDLVVVPSVTDVAAPRMHMRPVAGLPLLHVEQPQADEAGGLPKRVFDVVGAGIVLLMLSPVMLVVMALIKLEDRGPVFYRQARIGRDGGTFGCYKFRSMFVNADKMEARLRAEAGHEGALWKMEDDPRITRIGKFIRRFSVDELPQLINVVVGDMSLVGPRPQQAWEVETYTSWEDRRLRVRPGMTGLWQVSGRSQLSFDEAIRLDLYYVDNWSMTADLVIMAKTVRAVRRLRRGLLTRGVSRRPLGALRVMARLRRVNPSSKGWTRRRAGAGFVYLDEPGDRLTAEDIERIKALVIPPAWSEVWICPLPNGHIQAVGADAAGRRQYLYHPYWRDQRDAMKFARVTRVAARLDQDPCGGPRAHRLDGMPLERAAATAVRLLDLGYFRIGSDTYTDNNGSFGLTTLRARARDPDGDRLVFRFVGKSGIEHSIEIDDPLSSRPWRRCGGVAVAASGCSPTRTRRTWSPWTRRGSTGTSRGHRRRDDRQGLPHLARDGARRRGAGHDQGGRRDEDGPQARRASAMVEVSQYLGNTPAIAKSAYVDPRVVDHYESGTTIEAAARRTYRTPELRQAALERAVLRMLAE